MPKHPDRSADFASKASRVAEALGADGRTTFGLIPASLGHRTEELAMELGALLARHRSQTVGVVVGDPVAAERALKKCAAALPELVEVLAPPDLPDVGEMSRTLWPLVSAAKGRHGFVLLDASSAKGRDEQLALSRLVEAVCIVARRGVTTEADLLSLERDVDKQVSVGVLIAGP
jgi:hypothetical protein